MNRLTVADLTGGESRFGYPHPPMVHGSRLTMPRTEKHRRRADRTLRHPHQPVNAAALFLTAIAEIAQVLQKCISMAHEHPTLCLGMDGIHGAFVRQPRCTGAIWVIGICKSAGAMTLAFVLARGSGCLTGGTGRHE